jgi:enoyl-CoA hydratase/carnithine racemase
MPEKSESHIRIELRGAVAHLVMDRPDRFNSMDVPMAQDLRAAGLKLARDPAVRAVVFRGTGGKAFCAGADLKYIRAGGVRDELDYLAPPARPATAGSTPSSNESWSTSTRRSRIRPL